jgi:hypothetical protein
MFGAPGNVGVVCHLNSTHGRHSHHPSPITSTLTFSCNQKRAEQAAAFEGDLQQQLADLAAAQMISLDGQDLVPPLTQQLAREYDYTHCVR